jgi:CheY-like chemotaxis protein
MSKRVLLVDDDQNILDSLSANLRRRYDIHIALGPKIALNMLTEKGPFQAVVSDYKMPGMNGVDLLSKIMAISPKTMRIMLTGEADMQVSIDAVNSGQVFRFLTKPCNTNQLSQAIDAALEQNRLLNLEKDLLRNTLLGSISVIVEILSMVNPNAFGRSDRLRRLIVGLSREMKLGNSSKYELAALLSQIGCVSVPSGILDKRYSGQQLSPEEQHSFDKGIRTTAMLLKKIPRLEEVSDIIQCQLDTPSQEVESSLGSRLLLLALDYDDLTLAGKSSEDALVELRKNGQRYGAQPLAALEKLLDGTECRRVCDVHLKELEPGMILASDMRALDGSLMLSRGMEVTAFILDRLHSLAESLTIHEPIRILSPDAKGCLLPVEAS